MLASLRSAALLALTAFSLVACGEETEFLTDLSTAEATEDIALTEASFESEQVVALADLGPQINAALNGVSPAARVSAIVAAGPTPAVTAAPRMVEPVAPVPDEPLASIPASALGKTYEWSSGLQQYAQTARAGAPANAVRFILYRVNPETFVPLEPLEEVGTADLSNDGTAARPVARLVVRNLGGTVVLDYVATLSGTNATPSFSIQGSAGTGPNAATFSLTVGYNLISGNVAASWRTAIPTRGLTTRTTLAIGAETFTLNGVMQRGLRRVSLGGTLSFESGGQLTVKVGDRTFARIVVTFPVGGGLPVTTITNADGQPLTPEEEATLDRIFDWFITSVEWPNRLIFPVAALLGVAIE